jgi:hypothetical protein
MAEGLQKLLVKIRKPSPPTPDFVTNLPPAVDFTSTNITNLGIRTLMTNGNMIE